MHIHCLNNLRSEFMKLKHLRILIMVVLLLSSGAINLFAESPAKTGPLVLYADMVRGHTNPLGPVCAISSRFKQGEMVVWRARLIEGETGKAILATVEELLAEKPGNEALTAMLEGTSLKVHLSDGQTFDMRFAPHSGDDPKDYFWTTGWGIPEDYPTGTIDYWITAESGGRSVRWAPFDIGISKLTVE